MRSFEHNRYPLHHVDVLFQTDAFHLRIVVDDFRILIQDVDDEIGEQRDQRAFPGARGIFDRRFAYVDEFVAFDVVVRS